MPPSGASSIGSSSSNALIAKSSSTGTIAPTDIPFSVAMYAGKCVSAATRYGVSSSWSSSEETPRREKYRW